MPKIVHFEVPADDMDRAKIFYQTLFGWKIQPFQEGMDYWMIRDAEEGTEGQGIGGGMMPRQNPGQTIVNYIDVTSVDDYMAKVQELQGKIVVPKMPVPQMGYFAVCLDTEGNAFGLWETDPEAGMLADASEAFIAVLAAMIAADDEYTVDEMQTVWNEVESMDLFQGKEYRDMEARIFKRFNKDSAKPSAFSDQEVDLIITSAKQMLSPEQQEAVFRLAAKTAHSDKTLQGYVKEIDAREQRLLDRLEKGLEIPPYAKEKVMKEIQENRLA